jgi:transposase
VARFGSKLRRMTKATEAKWAERVREWRASGLSAEDFVAGKEYRASTLHWAASLVSGPGSGASGVEATASAGKPRSKGPSRRRPPVAAKTPRFLPVRAVGVGPALGEIVIEIGSARVRVARGFDGSLLGEVVRALGAAAR